MHASETIQQWFDHASRSFPAVTTGALLGAMVLGLVLWLLGGKLMKAAMVIAGLLLGLYAGVLLSGFASSAGFVSVLTIGMAIAGALAAALLFRVWMAVSTALLFAVVVPAAVLVWEGTPSTDIMGRSPADVTSDLQRRLNTGEASLDDVTRDRIQAMIDENSVESRISADSLLREQGIEAGKAAGEAIKGLVFENIEAVCDWWQDNTTLAQRNVALGMGVGALGGLLLGGLFPKHTAAIQAALVGAVLLFIPGRELIVDYAPEAVGWLPGSPRGGLIALGLITLLGVLVQWTLYFRPVDKDAE
ncbi:MAG: hypothetical protein AAGA29_14735 [Planctomycetota bacterium]